MCARYEVEKQVRSMCFYRREKRAML